MCGIIAVIRKDGKPAARSVAKRYHEQKTRGQEGFGYVAIRDNKVVAFERFTREKDFLESLAKETAPEIWAHHRRPTSTPNIVESAHPLFIEAPTLLEHEYFVLHNGVIKNTHELYQKHIKLGFVYQTWCMEAVVTGQGKTYDGEKKWNDSESLAIETALALDNKKPSIGSVGAAAVIGLKVKGDQVVQRFFYRNYSNPLVYINEKHMTTLTSVGKGTDVVVGRVHGLDERGEITEIHPVVTSPVSYKDQKGSSGRVPYAARYDDYDDYGGMPFGDISAEEFQISMGFRYPTRDIQHASQLPRKNTNVVVYPKKSTPSITLSPVKMTLDELWLENDRLIGEEERIGDAMDLIEQVTTEEGRISEADYVWQEKLRKELTDVHSRHSLVEALITAQESIQ